MTDELKGKLNMNQDAPVAEKKKTGFFSHKFYIVLFLLALVLVWTSLFWLHRISVRSLYSIIPDLISLIPDVLKELIQGFSFHLGFQANAFRNFLISRILFRAFLPLVFILLFSAGLRHRRGKFRREKALTVSALVFTVFCLTMRVYSDYCYRMSYTVSHLSDDEIYHKLSYLLFGEQLQTARVTAFYIIVLAFMLLVIILSLHIQKRMKRGMQVRYRWYRILCIVSIPASFLLPMLNGKYFQGQVLCMSVALLAAMVFLGTSLEVKEKKKRGAAIPESDRDTPSEKPQVQETEAQEAVTQETAEPETAEPSVNP